MKSALRLALGLVLGLVLGGTLNMALIMVSGYVIPPPPGADMTTAEGLAAALPSLGPRHFVFPFLAHAAGTLAGAFVAARLASKYKPVAAALVTAFFFAGGIMAARMIPAPSWFIALDLVGAYIPFGLAGYLLARPPPETAPRAS